MNKSTNISIVIPAHNEERLIRGCLDAIVAQTSKPQAVYVVDNNSTDRTAALAGDYPFVTVLSESKQGIVYARNRGFNAAADNGADIIARIDADSILPPDWLARIGDFYANPKHATLAITGGCYFYNLHLSRLTGFIYGLIVHRSNAIILGYPFPWGSNMALPATLWRASRGHTCTTIDVHEDLDLGIHLHQDGFSTRYVPSLKVGAVARRIVSERGKLWSYLRMWTRTLRLHHIGLWFLAEPLSLGVWVGAYVLLTLENIGNFLTGRRRA